MAKEILITVMAGAGDGKSTVAELIHQALKNVGLSVELVDDNGVGVVDELPGLIASELELRAEAIRQREHKVTILTRQARREGFVHG